MTLVKPNRSSDAQRSAFNVQRERQGAAWTTAKPASDGDETVLGAARRATDRRVDSQSLAPGDHIVQFYESDRFLASSVAHLVRSTLEADGAFVLIATESHRREIESRLRAGGLDLDSAEQERRYLARIADDTLTQFMVNDEPDPERFRAIIKPLLDLASGGGRPVSLFGEMVGLLADAGNHRATIRLEQFWNELRDEHGFALLCAYRMPRAGDELTASLMSRICAEHSQVIPAESFAGLPSADEQNRAVAMLQHKERWLEAELANQRQTEQQLQSALAAERAARAETEAALRSRDDFLSIAAHELRTPLAGLSAQAQVTLRRLKRDGEIEPERLSRSLDAINGQTLKLRDLIDRLLDVSRIEAGTLQLERQWVNLTALAAAVVARAQSKAMRPPITLAAPRQLVAFVDPRRFELALGNVLDNAICHSPEGGTIEISLGCVNGAIIELSVRDHGDGVPAEQRGNLFNRFHRAHDQQSGGGLGLGLYLTRQAIELHGGRVSAEFPADGGTRIVMRLPA